MIIKFLLLLGLSAAALVALRGRRSAANLVMRRFITFAGLACGATAVLYPSAVTAAANAVGVGRGTDLVLYLGLIAFLLTTITLYRRIHELEDRYVEVARLLAIAEAGRAAQAETPDSVGPARTARERPGGASV